MDIVRKQRPGRTSGRKYIIFAAAATFGLLLIMAVNIDFTNRRVDRNTLRIGTVEFGNLDIKITANGVLLPKQVEYLTSQVEGTVVKLHVKSGDLVVQGQSLVELSNPFLVSEFNRAASALEGSRAENISYTSDLKDQLLTIKQSVIEAKFALEKARLDLEANRQLADKGIVSQVNFRKIMLDVAQLEEIYEMEDQRFKQFEENIQNQMAIKVANINQASQVFENASAQRAALNVMAEMDGVVQELLINVGQHLQPGIEIGRIAKQDILFAEIYIPSRQAGDIAIGQRVELDTRNGVVEGNIARIDPAVIDGTVTVDVELTSELPRSARPELDVEATIYIEELTNVLYAGKPYSARTNSRQMIYVLDENEKYANRVEVEVGQSSINNIEILGGLQAGDKIILSDSSDWLDNDRILVD